MWPCIDKGIVYCVNLDLCKRRLLSLSNNGHVWLERIVDTHASACDTAPSVVKGAIVIVFLEILITICSDIWFLEIGVEMLVVEHLRVEGNCALRNES